MAAEATPAATSAATPAAPSLADRITKDTPAAESTTETESQVDGAGEPQHGSELREPEYDVEVKLVDLQGDPNNPLYSIKAFEDLGL